MPFSSGQPALLERIMPCKRLINNLFRILVLLLPAAFLYYELSAKDNLNEIGSAFVRQLDRSNAAWLLAVVLLLPVNWLAEVQKWRNLIVGHEPLSQWQALKAVMAGASFALITPNRVGEYGARILFVRPENQWKALMANVVGSLGQYVVILTGGIFGVFWFAGHLSGWSGQWHAGILPAALVPLCAVFYAYFNMGRLVPFLLRIPWLRRRQSLSGEIHFLEKIERRALAGVLAWSAFRYFVYTTQYFLLLQFFDINTGITAGYAGIATIYLLQTIVPLPALAGLLVRGSLAIFIWSHFGANEISSLAATFVLWIINLILPALFGTFSLFSVHITKSLGYEDD